MAGFDFNFGTQAAGGGPLDIAFADPSSLVATGSRYGVPDLTPTPSPFGLNFDTGKLALQGLGTIGSLWAAFQAQKLAKKQFSMTKKVTEANLGNSIASYNTTLEDRARSRAAVEGQSQEQMNAYIDKNRLAKFGG